MIINYSKAAAFLIIFLLWNIVSPYFIEYPTDPYGQKSGIGIHIYDALWITWLLFSLFIVVLYLLDSRKNKKADLPSETPTVAQSKTADFLTSFLLSIFSAFLLAFLISVSTDGFNFLGGDLAILFFIIFAILFIYTPSYLFVLRKKMPLNRKMLAILFIFTATYIFIFVPRLIKIFNNLLQN